MNHTTTPRRPSTAQPTTLTQRIPYEAGEALLWERQNHRVHAHLSIQMKELQTQHDAYNARIQATESIAEAAEAAVHKVKQMEARIAAMEEDDKDRPFDAWAQKCIKEFQVFVDNHVGVRQKLSGLEQRVGDMCEEVEGLGNAGGQIRGVLRRLEVLENERREETERVKALEIEIAKLRNGEERRESVHVDLQQDDNPLHVFYGIETQPPSTRQDHGVRYDRQEQDAQPASLSRPYMQDYKPGDNEVAVGNGNLQSPDEDILRPTDNSLDVLEPAPGIDYGWENTQQFKAMQKELAMLRAMCRTQEPRSSGQQAEATQRLNETIVPSRETNPNFSDATTEVEVEDNSLVRMEAYSGAYRETVQEPSSDMVLPSSPPKRQESQSARRNLMKRPSIYNPRISSEKEQLQPERQVLHPMTESDHARPSLTVKLPVETQTANAIPTKRKRVEDSPIQRVTRPRLADDRATAGLPSASSPRKSRPDDQDTPNRSELLTFDDDVPVVVASPARKTYGKRKQAADPPAQAAPQASSSRSKRPIPPSSKPTVSVAETQVTGKTTSKRKPAANAPAQQKDAPQARPSNSKAKPTAIKKEATARQPQGACRSCRTRHRKCDRTQPTCGCCAKIGASCEYVQGSKATAPPSGPSASPRKKQALPSVSTKKDMIDKHDTRSRSVTVSPEPPHHGSTAKRQTPAPKKSIVPTAPTAASGRAPRAKKAPNPKAPTQKKK